jgi:hypothetical protein
MKRYCSGTNSIIAVHSNRGSYELLAIPHILKLVLIPIDFAIFGLQICGTPKQITGHS